MKKLFIALLVTMVSCTTENVQEQQAAVINCGTIYSAQTLYTSGSPSTFIGVRYDMVLDAPYLGNTKAYFILNDALNTQTTEQYFTMGQPNYVCRNDLVYYP